MIPFPIRWGRYELLGLLGEGGTGRVYQADLVGPAGFRKPVALKVLRDGLRERGRQYARRDLIEEARMCSRLRHPNIIDVYELGEHEGQVFLAMEMVEGLTLARLIMDHAPIPPAVVLEVAVSIARGLERAHSERDGTGIIHCDLKPANVLISWEGEVKVADFGISLLTGGRSIVGGTNKTLVRGTPRFMSPEQQAGQPLDGRSDLYAWALVTGALTIARKLQTFPLTSGEVDERALRDVGKRISGLDVILRSCLATNPDNRCRSASDALHALEALRDQHPAKPRLVNWLREQASERRIDVVTHTTQTATMTLGDAFITDLGGDTSQHQGIDPDPDSFLGRSRELVELRRAYTDKVRLVTLKGTGGVGKTRLARHFGRTTPGFESVRFVDLTESHSLDDLLLAVERALGTHPRQTETQQERLQRLGTTLSSRGRLLLILDNTEQIIAEAREAISIWLQAAPQICLLITSREALKLRGERLFPLEPLPPDIACHLFRDRATAQGALWPDEPQYEDAIATIASLLDGLPLAIELAASRATLFGPTQLVDQISSRLGALRGRGHPSHERQSTMRSLIDWSWQLLTGWERSALAQLSVFRDGFFLEAAEAVVDLSPWPDAPWILDVVASLYDKSLLHSQMADDRPRFGMYLSIHGFAAQQLRTSDGDHDLETATQLRHAEYFSQLSRQCSEHANPLMSRPITWSEMELEYANFMAAATPTFGEHGAQAALGALEVIWRRGPVSRGLDLIESFHPFDVLSTDLHAAFQLETARFARILSQQDRAANAIAQPVVSLASGRASPTSPKSVRLEVLRLCEQGRQRHLRGAADMAEPFEHALALCEEHDDDRGRAITMGSYGTVLYQQGDPKGAIEAYRLALSSHQTHNDQLRTCMTTGALGNVHLGLGELPAALRCFQNAFDLATEVGEHGRRGIHLANLGVTYEALHQYEDSIRCYESALPIFRDHGDQLREGMTIANMGSALYRLGRIDEVEEHLQRALPLVEGRYIPSEFSIRSNLAALFAEQERFDEARSILASCEEKALSHREEYAKFKCRRADVERRAGDTATALRLISEAKEIAAELGVNDDSALGWLINECESKLAADRI